MSAQLIQQLSGVAGLGLIVALMAVVNRLGEKHREQRAEHALWTVPDRHFDARKYPQASEGMRALVDAVKQYADTRAKSEANGSMRDAYVAADDARLAYERMIDALDLDVQRATKREGSNVRNDVRVGVTGKP